MDGQILIPNRLVKGDKVRVVAPAGPFDPENLKIGIRFLESIGLVVENANHLFESSGYLAGNDNDRLKDIVEAFSDESVKGVFCARGGYGSLRLLKNFPFGVVSDNPKVFLGFSDITALSMAFFNSCGLVTFSAPMVAGTQVGKMTDQERDHFRALIMEASLHTIPGKGKKLIGQTAQGPLLGGNLTLLVHCLAAGILPSLDGAILFFEDVNEPPYRIDRYLTTLRLSGRIEKIAGVVVGEILGISEGEVERIVIDCLGDLRVPIITGFPVGHGNRNIALPIGAECGLDAENGTIGLLRPAVL